MTSRDRGSKAATLALALLGLGSSGCVPILTFQAEYGGPDRESDFETELIRELQMRDLQFAVDFNCESELSNCEREADSEIRSLMSELGVLGGPDYDARAPRYEIDFLIDEYNSFPSWGFVQNFFALATLGTVVPFFGNQSSTEVAAVVSEHAREQEGNPAAARLRDMFVAMRGGSVFLYGEAYDEVFTQPQIVAAAVSTFDHRSYGSLLLPMPCLSTQRNCIATLFLLSYGQGWKLEEASMPPGAWYRQSLELTTRRLLLELVRQLPIEPARSTSPQ